MATFAQGQAGHVVEHNRVHAHSAGTGPLATDADLSPLLAGIGKGAFHLPVGTFTASEPIVIPAGAHLVGAGSSTSQSGAATVIKCAGSGVILGGNGARLSGVYLLHTGAVAESNGVTLRASRTTVEDVTVKNFGQDGFHAESDSPPQYNCNLARLIRCRADTNGRYGFYIKGADSNLMIVEMPDAVGNGSYGYFNGSAKTTYINPHASANVGGGFYDDGNSNTYLNPYVESGVGFSFVVAALSYYGTYLSNSYGSPWIEFEQADPEAPNGNYPGGGWTVIQQGEWAGNVNLKDGRLRVQDNAGKQWQVRVNAQGGLYTTALI